MEAFGMEEQKHTLGELYQIQLSEKKKTRNLDKTFMQKWNKIKFFFSFISAQFADLKKYIDQKFNPSSSSQEIIP